MEGSTWNTKFLKRNEVHSLSPSQINDEAVEFHWKTFPAHAKQFILATVNNLSLKRLVDFWGSHAEYTSGSVAGGIYGASWYLALVYLHRNDLPMATSLILNGSFLQECYFSTFEHITHVCNSITVTKEQLPYFYAGMQAIRSRQLMHLFLQRSLPQEYQQMLASFVNMGTKNRMMNFIGDVNQDWEKNGLKTSSKKPTRSNCDDENITLIIGCDSFEVGPSIPLKSVFNEYAEKNLVSLKSLRFSYAGKPLFLTSAGKKSPAELGMLNNDAIEVHANQEAVSSDDDKQSNKKKNSRVKKQRKTSKKIRSKNEKGSSKIEVIKSNDEYKEEHSKILSKVFEEADPKFKQIRQELNTLNLLKQQPKTRAQTKQPTQVNSCFEFDPTSEGLGGKAGKTRFVVNVGEVNNLYKSSKSLDKSVASTASTIDLHGCTQEEAISRLNAGLKEWSERAMLGTYPFVHSVSIVCGGGGQVLSEVVEKWIGQNQNVSNAPKRWISKQRFGAAA